MRDGQVEADPIERPDRLYAKPGRGAMTPRHMTAAMIPMVLVVLLAGGLLSQCSFSPGGPSGRGVHAAAVDMGRELRILSARLDFAVREPALPGGWRATSVGTGTAGREQARSIRVGMVTEDGRYLRFVQSGASEGDLVTAETGEPRTADGEVTTDQTVWRTYPAARSERAWVGEVDGVRILITGDAVEEDFRRLARALPTAPSVPTR